MPITTHPHKMKVMRFKVWSEGQEEEDQLEGGEEEERCQEVVSSEEEGK